MAEQRVFDGSARHALRSDVRYRVIGDEVVVVCQENAEVLVLNDVGTRVLQLVAEAMSAGDVVEKLLEEYEVDRRRLEIDVASVLAELVEAGVLEEAPERG